MSATKISTDLLHRIRDYAVEEPSFTIPFAAWELKVSSNAIQIGVASLLKGGIIHEIEPRQGPYAAVYAYRPIPGEGQTVRRTFSDDIGVKPPKRGGVVAHTRREGPSGKPGLDRKRSRKGVRVRRERQGT